MVALARIGPVTVDVDAVWTVSSGRTGRWLSTATVAPETAAAVAATRTTRDSRILVNIDSSLGVVCFGRYEPTAAGYSPIRASARVQRPFSGGSAPTQQEQSSRGGHAPIGRYASGAWRG